MILPLIVDAAGVFIMKQFFDSVPISIEEAARIDGAGVFRTFWSVVLPMARPALITLDDPVVPGVVERVLALPGHDAVAREAARWRPASPA